VVMPSRCSRQGAGAAPHRPGETDKTVMGACRHRLLWGHTATSSECTSPAADRTTNRVKDPRSVSRWVRTTAAGLGYILTVSRSSPSTCRKIKYSNRSDTRGSCPTTIAAGQRPRTDFWHPAPALSPSTLAEIRATKLSDIIPSQHGATDVQDDVMLHQDCRPSSDQPGARTTGVRVGAAVTTCRNQPTGGSMARTMKSGGWELGAYRYTCRNVQRRASFDRFSRSQCYSFLALDCLLWVTITPTAPSRLPPLVAWLGPVGARTLHTSCCVLILSLASELALFVADTVGGYPAADARVEPLA